MTQVVTVKNTTSNYVFSKKRAVFTVCSSECITHRMAKKKTQILLSEIHKFHSSSLVFSGYEVDSVHERLKD